MNPNKVHNIFSLFPIPCSLFPVPYSLLLSKHSHQKHEYCRSRSQPQDSTG
ncbi:MAG: hypothetical protein F6K26_22685 [Moorea sp. SIO2I5]|nr:hypothetical protein [Moorena sp. SIO2I5]